MKINRILNRLLFFGALFVLTTTGCGKMSLELSSKSNFDFKLSDITISGSNIADGTTQMLMIVTLKNSDNSFVAGYTPTFTVTPSSGVITSNCSVSTKQGVSVCVLKATTAGTRNFNLTNVKINLNKDFTFLGAAGGQVLALSSGGLSNGTTAGGYKARLTLGSPTSGKTVTTTGGYQISLSFQPTVK